MRRPPGTPGWTGRCRGATRVPASSREEGNGAASLDAARLGTWGRLFVGLLSGARVPFPS